MPLFYNLDGFGDDTDRVARRLMDIRARMRNHPEDANQRAPAKNVSDTLLVATWNIQAFDGGEADNRTEESYWYIAEIVSHFDLIAIQEVGANLGGLDKLKARLGPTWDYLVTDVTEGKAGNMERLAFLYDRRKALLGGVAGEIVIPPIEDAQGNTIAPSHQLVRTPSIVGFQSGWFRFMITTVHIIWGGNEENDPNRVREVDALAAFLKRRSENENAWSQNHILLGDFNIFTRSPDNEAFAALLNNGFVIPEALQQVPRTNVGTAGRFYDQIALKVREKNLEPTGRAGVFDYFEVVYRDEDFDEYVPAMMNGFAPNDKKNPLTFDTRGKLRSREQQESYYRNHWRRRQMSDHLPMWVELKIDHGETYLQNRF